MDIELISRRLVEARTERKMTLDDIAIRVGVAKSTIGRYEKGQIARPKLPVVESIALAIGVNPAWLVGKSDIKELETTKRKGVTINVYGKVAAGIPIEAIEDIIDTEDIPDELAKTGEFFGLRIQGDSMEPDIKDDDTVIVRRQETADEGNIVIAMVNGYDATCKRLRLYDDSIALESLNATYAPMYYTKKEVEEKPVSIIGVVKESRRKF